MTPSYPDARTLLRKYGLYAKKSWGQNFLVEERAFAGIVKGAGASASDPVVEIGAGVGTLTARLADVSERVVAIERDRDMITILRGELGQNPRVEILEANALTVDYAELASRLGGKLIVVGNLPYQIASQILFRLLDARAHIARIVVMLQLEMAVRLLAPPSTKEYGAMTVMVRMVGEPKILFRVSPGAFHPAPRVASAVVRIEPLPVSRAAVRDPRYFSEVVHAAFGQRRKTLRNSLRTVAAQAAVDRGLVAAGIAPELRGETLDVEAFARLSDALQSAIAEEAAIASASVEGETATTAGETATTAGETATGAAAPATTKGAAATRNDLSAATASGEGADEVAPMTGGRSDEESGPR